MGSSLDQALKHIHYLLNSRKVDEATQLCQQTLKQFPKSAAPCLLLAQIESQKGQYGQAIDALKKAIKRKPKDQGLHCMQGDLYMQLQQPVKAEKAYQAALRILPQDNTIKTRLASALQLQKEKIDKAIELYEDVVKSQPNSSDAYYNLGTVLKRKNDFNAAVLAYKNAAKLAPEDAELRFRLSNLLFEAGHFVEAADELEISLVLKPDMPSTLYQLSYVTSV